MPSVSSSYRSGGNITSPNTSASSSPTSTFIRGSQSSGSDSTYSTDRSTPPASPEIEYSGRHWTGLPVSPTDGSPPASATSFLLSPQYCDESVFALSLMGSLSPSCPLVSPAGAVTVYTGASAVFSMDSPSLQTSEEADLYPYSKPSPTNVYSPNYTGSITSYNSLISPCISPTSPPAITQSDNFYKEYTGTDSPSCANVVATEGFGESTGRRDFWDTPPPSYPAASTFYEASA